MTHSLERRALGRTGLSVSRLGFGAMAIRGERAWRGRRVFDEHAHEILHAVDAGINFTDTSSGQILSTDTPPAIRAEL
jgi:aryl-alcohol dehydrogenase-like predicted oxidoreductase